MVVINTSYFFYSFWNAYVWQSKYDFQKLFLTNVPAVTNLQTIYGDKTVYYMN